MNKVIKLFSHDEAQDILGPHDENIRLLEKELRVKVTVRGEHIKITGTQTNIKKANTVIERLLENLRLNQQGIDRSLLYALINDSKRNKRSSLSATPSTAEPERKVIVPSLRGMNIGPKTKGQEEYVQAIKNHDIVFGLGPAGTGKTYLAMSCAVEALKKQEVRRIILTRPAIEAGESLGYLPGDIYEKISPYLRPLYDAMYDMLEAERIEKYLETGIVEVAPLAYMRGRTLNDAFIILDEAQNCTVEQMKMFLTRLGFYSKAVITGDLTQSDLPDGKPSGLMQAQEILKDIEGIKFIYFTGQDVVRHALVQSIIEAYDKANH